MILNRSAASLEKEVAAARAVAVQDINRQTGAVRCRFITDIPGQQMIYADKEAEARAFVDLQPDPLESSADMSRFPFIEKEIGTTAPTAYEVAQVFLNLAAQWRVVGADLEALRVRYNNRVYASVSQAEIDQLMADFSADLEFYK
ncbi:MULTISPECIES: hypothetical protein [unclassified Sulfitobacter]|uniref:hypothetical protein n=1 Tax=unclassified Sulfitobacter TaxID=196795 RepID=UPI0023E16A17|nr:MULTISPECIES: hypothetical protein [unclassified Sulfitobacter]MDF3383371.1 hypothetical protein [Sulfitobacter sp. Ks11]MDF3386790.1 hypothetical protein [Sulfitobacter sp. M85]MDF3390209.1 hypothetical protein [Sulfitobacter sp. Ks16]MDF3400846.1 hypothetical protein [Sulfitobacter sp. KE39]MDF3404267.1 hypothetical protein [Sulfitobacter sp. Ks35]